MTSKTSLTPAWVLHLRDYRETSRICDLLTLEQGRISVIAKGVRGRRNSLSADLQPFRPLLLSWVGRSELKTLATVELTGTAPQLNGEALYCGYYLNELLLRVCPAQDPVPEIFELYSRSIEQLADGNEQQQTLRLFERDLLECLGLGLELDQDTAGQPISPACRYRYQQGEGLSLSQSSDSVSGAALQALQAGIEITGESRVELRKLLQGQLQPLLGDRPLKSRELFRQLRR